MVKFVFNKECKKSKVRRKGQCLGGIPKVLALGEERERKRAFPFLREHLSLTQTPLLLLLSCLKKYEDVK